MAESLQVFITASAARLPRSSAQPFCNAGEFRQIQNRADKISKNYESPVGLKHYYFFSKKRVEIKLKIMTVYVQIKTYHDELLCFMLSIQALLLWCQSVRVSQTLTVRSQ